ncbi:MAG: leucine-rich repeat domain-containing protein [Bacilli bacterium]|nr:leucine-rich repeat domain-containing protein [Bacilli bacterium]
MEHHSFSDFSYAINKTSEKKGYKEILVCYIYNGVEVLRKIYIKDEPGKSSYIFEAKQIIDKEMKSGTLASYSHKFVKRKNNGGKSSKKAVLVTAGIAAVLIAGMSVGMFFAGKGSVPLPEPIPERTTFEVRFTYDSCSADGPSQVEKNAAYECKFTAAQNKQIVSVSSVMMGTKLLTNDVDYSFDGKTLKINEGVITDDLYIHAYGHGEHEVTAEMEYEFDGNTAKAVGVKYDQTKLKDIGTIIIPNSVPNPETGETATVVEIEKGALAGCGYLQNLSIPFVGRYKNPTATNSIEDQMLGYIFGDEDYSGGIPVWQDYLEDPTDISTHKMKKWIIPNDLSDISITGDSPIGIGAFSECNRINDITISGNVGEIGNYAFYNCKALETVVFPEGIVSKIGAMAFSSCNTLTAVGPRSTDEETVLFNLKGVTEIGDDAFSDCSGAQETFIPKTVEKVGTGAFASVGGIVMVEDYEEDVAEKDWDKDWASDTTAVIYGSNGSVTPIKDGNFKFIVTTEKDNIEYAFVTEYVGEQYEENPVIPYSLSDGNKDYPIRHLGMGLFYQYTPFKTVTFNCTDLLSIGNYCFMGCYNLEQLYFIAQTPGNGNFNLKTIGAGAFLNCSSLQINDVINPTDPFGDNPMDEGVLPASIKTVGASAFKGCTNLVQVSLPNASKIGASTFEGCFNLKKVKITADVVSVGAKAYLNCAKLTSIEYYWNQEESPDWDYVGKDFKVISDECFKNTSISGEQSIPYYITSIGASAFENCPITKFTLEVGNNGKADKLRTIGDNAFAGCSKLTDVSSLGKATGLDSIGSNAFRNCIGITSVGIGNVSGESLLTTISDSAFDGCINMTSFACPTNSLKSIGAKAFFDCRNITSFMNAGNLPATLSKVGDSAFYNCVGIPQLIFNYQANVSTSLEFGNDVFKGWVTKHTNIDPGILYNSYESDTSGYISLAEGWLNETHVAFDGNIHNYTTKWGWYLADNSTCATGGWSGDKYPDQGYTERYKCSALGNDNLYIHIVKNIA